MIGTVCVIKMVFGGIDMSKAGTSKRIQYICAAWGCWTSDVEVVFRQRHHAIGHIKAT